MKVEGTDEEFVLFINNQNKKYLFDSKEITVKNIKDLIVRLIRYYDINIKGIYNLTIYQNDKLGLVIEGLKKDDFSFSNNIIDLKLSIIKDYDFFFKCEDYFQLSNYKNKFYYDNNYYISINDVEDILDIIEHVEIIYGDKKAELLKKLIEI